MQRDGDPRPVPQFSLNVQALLIQASRLSILPCGLGQQPQLVQGAGNARPVTQFLIDVQALLVEPPRLGTISRVLSQHAQLVVDDGHFLLGL